MFKVTLQTVVIVACILILVDKTSAWRRRRRRRCDSHACQWKWGACSVTCGGGLSNPIKTAERGPCGPACNLPAPRACNEQCCKVDCIQDQWSMWSNCTASCGVDGVSIRKRITKQEMACDGIPCGVSEESKPCNRFCFNRGMIDNGTCRCAGGWKGRCCDEDINECESTTCTPNATCFNSVGSYECVCDHGFSKHELHCIDIDECSLMQNSSDKGINASGSRDNETLMNFSYDVSKCHAHAICENLEGNYVCECATGYLGDGFKCEEPVPQPAYKPSPRVIALITVLGILVIAIGGVTYVIFRIRRSGAWTIPAVQPRGAAGVSSIEYRKNVL